MTRFVVTGQIRYRRVYRFRSTFFLDEKPFIFVNQDMNKINLTCLTFTVIVFFIFIYFLFLFCYFLLLVFLCAIQQQAFVNVLDSTNLWYRETNYCQPLDNPIFKWRGWGKNGQSLRVDHSRCWITTKKKKKWIYYI